MTRLVLLIAALSLAACSPETKTKIALLIGEKTVLEKEADIYGKRSIELLDHAMTLRANGDEAHKQVLREAIDKRMEALNRYNVDCDNGNHHSCAKFSKLIADWEARRPKQ